MKQESLEKALDGFIETLDRLDIDTVDKVELMLNLKSFLSALDYTRNIEILERDRLSRKYIGGNYETDKSVEVPKRR